MASLSNLSAKQIVGTVIALLLVGILLPIGVNELTSAEVSNKTETTTLSNQSVNFTRNITLYADQELNATVEYTDSLYLFNLTLYTPSSTILDSDQTANQTLTIEENATVYGVHVLNVSNADSFSASKTFNLTYTITTFIDSDTKDNLETFLNQVIPIIAVVGLVMAFIPIYKKYS